MKSLSQEHRPPQTAVRGRQTSKDANWLWDLLLLPLCTYQWIKRLKNVCVNRSPGSPTSTPTDEYNPFSQRNSSPQRREARLLHFFFNLFFFSVGRFNKTGFSILLFMLAASQVVKTFSSFFVSAKNLVINSHRLRTIFTALMLSVFSSCKKTDEHLHYNFTYFLLSFQQNWRVREGNFHFESSTMRYLSPTEERDLNKLVWSHF